jgi:co-chaperonin GroES (HSP10)
MLRPIRDRVVVEPIKAAETIYIAGEPQGVMHGKIVAHGPGRRLESGVRALSVSVGDRILYPAACGQQIAGSGLLVMTEDDILAVLED